MIFFIFILFFCAPLLLFLLGLRVLVIEILPLLVWQQTLFFQQYHETLRSLVRLVSK